MQKILSFLLILGTTSILSVSQVATDKILKDLKALDKDLQKRNLFVTNDYNIVKITSNARVKEINAIFKEHQANRDHKAIWINLSTQYENIIYMLNALHDLLNNQNKNSIDYELFIINPKRVQDIQNLFNKNQFDNIQDKLNGIIKDLDMHQYKPQNISDVLLKFAQNLKSLVLRVRSNYQEFLNVTKK